MTMGRVGRVAVCVAVWICGCALEEPPLEQSAFPSAGLYTPGSRLGASDPTDTPTPGAGLGDRCVPLKDSLDPESDMATTGTLTIEYKTRTMEGRYAPDNCTAAWIETMDGRYVATIEIGAGLRREGLVYWQDHACTEKPGPDVVTSATLPDHEGMHKAVWRAKDLERKLVPDGTYVLFIEVTESDKEPGEVMSWQIDKGPEAYGGPFPVDAEAPMEELTVTWMPDGAEASGAAP